MLLEVGLARGNELDGNKLVADYMLLVSAAWDGVEWLARLTLGSRSGK